MRATEWPGVREELIGLTGTCAQAPRIAMSCSRVSPAPLGPQHPCGTLIAKVQRANWTLRIWRIGRVNKHTEHARAGDDYHYNRYNYYNYNYYYYYNYSYYYTEPYLLLPYDFITL